MKTAACKTSVNTGDSSGFAIQIVVLNVLGSSPSGHPNVGKVSKIAKTQCLSAKRKIPP